MSEIQCAATASPSHYDRMKFGITYVCVWLIELVRHSTNGTVRHITVTSDEACSGEGGQDVFGHFDDWEQ